MIFEQLSINHLINYVNIITFTYNFLYLILVFISFYMNFR